MTGGASWRNNVDGTSSSAQSRFSVAVAFAPNNSRLSIRVSSSDEISGAVGEEESVWEGTGEDDRIGVGMFYVEVQW